MLEFESVKNVNCLEPEHGDGISIPEGKSWTGLSASTLGGYLLAGGLAGGISRTLTAPCERVKVFLQVHPEYDGPGSCLKDLIREGGVRGLWRGNAMNVMKTVPDTALKFMAYEEIKEIIKSHEGHRITIYDRIFAGSMAGCFSQTIIYPLEVLKTRLTLRRTDQYSSMIDAVSKIMRKEGIRSFYRGFVPNLMGVIPYSGIDLSVYETIKLYYIQKDEDAHHYNTLFFGCCAAVSSTCGLLVSYPLSLIRTKLQAQELPLNYESAEKLTMRSLFRTIIQRDGFFGLYRGLLTNICKVIPAVCSCYMLNEKIRQFLGISVTS